MAASSAVFIVLVLVVERRDRSCGVRSPIVWRGAASARFPLTVNICLNVDAAETRENRRLPRITQRDAALWAGCKRIESHE